MRLQQPPSCRRRTRSNWSCSSLCQKIVRIEGPFSVGGYMAWKDRDGGCFKRFILFDLDKETLKKGFQQKRPGFMRSSILWKVSKRKARPMNQSLNVTLWCIYQETCFCKLVSNWRKICLFVYRNPANALETRVQQIFILKVESRKTMRIILQKS